MTKAILLVSHGSSSKKTKDEIIFLVNKLQKRWKKGSISYAFLELEKPSIPEAIEDCVHQGASELKILLNFLNSGRHVDTDIPQIILKAKEQYPHITFQVTQPVGQHQGIIDLFLQIIHEK